MTKRNKLVGAGITGGQAANSLPRGCAGKERVGQESKGRPQMLGIYWYPVHSSWAAADTPLGMQPCENAFCGTSVYVTIWGTQSQHVSNIWKTTWVRGHHLLAKPLFRNQGAATGPVDNDHRLESWSSLRHAVNPTPWGQGQTVPKDKK